MLDIYVVRRGDTLWGISGATGVPLGALAEINRPPYLDRLTPGQTLIYPVDTAEPPPPEPPEPPQPPPPGRYIVQRGDTLAAIARRFGVTAEAIARLNNITNPNLIFAGQELLIPAIAPPGTDGPATVSYVFRAGDTLYTIGLRFGTPWQAIAAANNIQAPWTITPGQVLRIPVPTSTSSVAAPQGVASPPVPPAPAAEGPPQAYPAIVNAWLPVVGPPFAQGEESDDARAIAAAASALTYVSIFRYSFRDDGSLVVPPDETALAAARRYRVAPLLTLANLDAREQFSSVLAHNVLTSEGAESRLVAGLLGTMAAKGYAGINVDLEYVSPGDREEYNSFLRRLAAELRPRGLLLTTDVPVKYSADQPGTLYEAIDYPVHGEVADLVMVMTYEWGWAGGPPMAIAPLNEVRRALDYAVSAVPRQKILMGMPNYARDWRVPYQAGTTARTFTVQAAVRLAIDQGVPIEYDPVAESPHFAYTDATGQAHIVWFEDARSIAAKLHTMKDFGLRGVAIWEAAAEFPQLWPLLLDRLAVIRV